MPASRDPRSEVKQVCTSAPLGLAASALLVLGSAFLVPAPYMLAGALLLVPNAALVLGLVVISWRYYNFWFSWLIWAVPGAAVVGIGIAQALLPPIATEFVSPAAAIAAAVGLAGLGFFLSVLVFRRHIRKWFAI